MPVEQIGPAQAGEVIMVTDHTYENQLTLSCVRAKDSIPEQFHHLACFPVLFPKRVKCEEEHEKADPSALTGLRIAM